MTKKIPLTQDKFVLVDDTDFEYLNQWKWHATRNGNAFYAKRTGKGIFSGKAILMHRVIMDTPHDMEVDHIDGNGLNNTRSNLRNCTRTENKQNSKRKPNNTTGYKGVFRHHTGKWFARITVNGEKIHLGHFANIEDAAHAYDEAAKKYFGEFANTNF